jgi:hypothetical protein
MTHGIFAQWQPRYAERGIPTFPVDGVAKKPAVNGYLNVGPDLSRQLALKFSAIDAFGVALGRRNRFTILDVDTTDERVLADALTRHGPTPFIVRSGSGNFQGWYRHNGERRRIRPVRDVPVDILGGGYVVAPPSQGRSGRYQIIQGSLDDLARLPVMRGAEQLITGHRNGNSAVKEGGRNDAMFKFARHQAPHVDDLDALLDVVRTRNDQACDPPLPDAEIVALVTSAWRWQTEGRNFIGGKTVFTTFDEIDALASTDPDALALLVMLRRFHYGREEFALAKAMAGKLGWSLKRFKDARGRLVTSGYIKCIHPGGRGQNDPPIYVLVRGAESDPYVRGTESYPNTNYTPAPATQH